MGNCQVCGRSSSIYTLCPNCNDRKKQGKIRRCDECGNWSDGSDLYCSTCKWKFQERKDALQETNGSTNRSVEPTNPSQVRAETVEKPAERTDGFGKGRFISIAAKGLTTGMQKTKEVTKDAYGTVKEKMPTFKGQQEAARSSEESPKEDVNNYRNKYPRDFRTHDGHFVRSASEQALDNWFYSKQILHEYERAVTPLSGDWMSPDFYLPYDKNGKYLGNLPGGMYVEYWGLEEKEGYKEMMEYKKKVYNKENLFLIDIYPADMKDYTTELPKIFMKYFGDKVK